MTDEARNVVISGPQWITQGYFDAHYKLGIRIRFEKGDKFRLGAADGTDTMAQRYLIELCRGDTTALSRVTVFNKGTKDGRLDDNFKLTNGYDSYPLRDLAMCTGMHDYVIHLPAFGGAVCGSMLIILRFMCLTDSRALELFEAMRRASERFPRAEICNRVVPMYEALYPENVESE